MSVTIPVPTDLLSVTWFLIGFCFGRGFGKQLDQEIQLTEWSKKRHPILRWFIKRLLDTIHHFWIGLLLMLYAPSPEIYWFGVGLFVDDWPDIPRRFKKLFKPLTKR